VFSRRVAANLQSGLPSMSFCREFAQRASPLCAGTLFVAPGGSRLLASLLSIFSMCGFSACPIIVFQSEDECTGWIRSQDLTPSALDLAHTFADMPGMAEQLQQYVARCTDEGTRAHFGSKQLGATLQRMWAGAPEEGDTRLLGARDRAAASPAAEGDDFIRTAAPTTGLALSTRGDASIASTHGHGKAPPTALTTIPEDDSSFSSRDSDL
jgi:hypothetical protein